LPEKLLPTPDPDTRHRLGRTCGQQPDGAGLDTNLVGLQEVHLPVNNRAFWRAKLDGNRRRDRRVSRQLRRLGWRVLRVWEHDLRPKREAALARRLLRFLAA
jgi:hypothetical protein